MAWELVVPVAAAASDGTGEGREVSGRAGASVGTGDRGAPGSPRDPGPTAVRRLGLLSNRKRHGDIVLEELARRLHASHPGLTILPRSKPNYSLPAPDAVLRELAAGCDAVLSSIAD